MARFNTVVESPTALTTGINSASGTTGGLFACLNLSAAGTARMRRLTFGVRAGTGAPTSQQVSIAAIRSSARGTQTTTATPNQLDPNSTTSLMRVDSAWSTTPTLAGTALANYSFEVSFNTQSGVDLPWELLEELWIQGANNGLAFFNVGNALPTSHLYTASFEWEE
ncbi:MAG TPA: hypothetical protein VKG80_13810 [Trebonia sp.]|nr:hypothetical protein [Trebonia sp.]